MKKTLGHIKVIVNHKYYVFQACLKSGIPIRGITHDLSKFSFAELLPSIKYYNGKESPVSIQKRVEGSSSIFAHHKGRNSHHWEYWVDWTHGSLYCMKMPITDVKELLCDWVGAGKAYNKEKWNAEEAPNYYYDRRDHMLFHNETRELIEEALNVLKLEGEIAFYKFVKEMDYESAN